MFIHLSDVFTSEGQQLDLETELEMTGFDNGAECFEIAGKSPVALSIAHLETGKALVKADMQLVLKAACDRCLAEVPVKLELHTERVIFSPERQAEVDVGEQNFVSDYELDVEALAHDMIIGNWPAKILCKEDCKGICPVCGQDLNAGECGCDRFIPDPRMAGIQDIFNAVI